jgi:hypothetical protein
VRVQHRPRARNDRSIRQRRRMRLPRPLRPRGGIASGLTGLIGCVPTGAMPFCVREIADRPDAPPLSVLRVAALVRPLRDLPRKRLVRHGRSLLREALVRRVPTIRCKGLIRNKTRGTQVPEMKVVSICRPNMNAAVSMKEPRRRNVTNVELLARNPCVSALPRRRMQTVARHCKSQGPRR